MKTRMVMLAAVTAASVLAACGGAGAPPEIVWADATGADVFASAGVTSYRQRRTLTIEGTAADAQGVAGTLTTEFESISEPAASLQITLTGSPPLSDLVLSQNGDVASVLAIEDETWFRSPSGDWTPASPDVVANPIFGPFAQVVNFLLSVVPVADAELDFVGSEDASTGAAYHYQGSGFTVTNAAGIALPIDQMDVWIDERGFLTRTDIIATSGDAGVSDLTYRFSYEVYDLGASITLSPPAS